MSEDVYSQLLRQIDEAQHRWDIEAVISEVARLSTGKALTAEETGQLLTALRAKRVELINREVPA